MKKLSLFLIILCGAGIFLWTGPASAYTINDTLTVGKGQSLDSGDDDTFHGWQDFIGEEFNIFGIDFSFSSGDLTLNLYSNFDGDASFGGVDVDLADLKLDLDCDGVYELGVALTNRGGVDAGGIYSNPQWNTAFHYFENKTVYDPVYDKSNFYYGQFLEADPDTVGGVATTVTYVDVHLTGGDKNATYEATFGTGTFPQELSGDPGYLWEVTIPIADLGWTGADVGVFWAGSTCANDIIEGKKPVPEPATMLLLGAGLVGIAGFGRKRLFKK